MLALRKIGRYLLGPEIGRGGMATVHVGRMHGPGGFARTVALKRLQPTLAADPQFVAALFDEARIAARVRHPNVLPIFDVVREGSDVLLVLDYVHGWSLSTLVACATKRGEVVPIGVAFAILRGVLDGLQAAHDARSENGTLLELVHRDVSPQNVLVGVDGVARLIDFGVAKALGRSEQTREGYVKGKIAYMAPEQLDGKAKPASDVFASGIILWELIAGRRLFAGETQSETVLNALTMPIPPACDARLERGEITGGAARDLDRILARALDRDISARFSSAVELADALEAVLGAPSPRSVAKWVQRIAPDLVDAQGKLIAALEESTPGSTPPPRAPDGGAATAAPAPQPAGEIESTAPEIPALRGEISHGAPHGDELRSEEVAVSFSGAEPILATSTLRTPIDPLRPADRALPRGQRPLRARAWIASAAALVVLVALAGAFTRARGPSSESGDAGAEVASPHSASAPSQSVSAASPQAVDSSLREPPPPSGDATAQVAAPSSSPAKKRPIAPTTAPRAKTGVCANPYEIGADGRKHFKRECFK